MRWFDHMGAWSGFDDEERLVAQVVHYDTPEGWQAVVRTRPVTGIWTAADAAKAAVEQLLDA